MPLNRLLFVVLRSLDYRHGRSVIGVSLLLAIPISSVRGSSR